MITRQIEHVALLLLIAAVVAMLARKAHLPYTVGLLLTGFGLALLRSAPTFHLSKELIFSAFLSPLIFEAAFYLPWRELRRDLLYILFLASAGVLLAAGVTGVGMHYGAAWAWPTALLFGVLIAATDPVSVIATFKETRVPERLKIIVEAESLFNDGTAAVAFGVALAVVQGGDLTGAGISRERASPAPSSSRFWEASPAGPPSPAPSSCSRAKPTPVEEVLGTLDTLVKAGKIRYIGCSNFSGWHLMKSLAASEKYGLTRYVATRRTIR